MHYRRLGIIVLIVVLFGVGLKISNYHTKHKLIALQKTAVVKKAT